MKDKKKLVTNKNKSGEFSTFTFNLKVDKARVRHDVMNGRDHLVVPAVMITEGVHNGSLGPLFYSEEELVKRPGLWDMKPVVVYHPQANGEGVSACSVDIINTYGIGVLMNTHWEKDGLKTECWVEEEKTKKVDDRVLSALDDGEMMEVSTGLFTEIERTDGEWEGEKYIGIARNFQPDHLAILPDLKGACSIEDGAGFLRNAEGMSGAEKLLAQSLFKVFNELSHSEIWRMLNDKISTASMDTWVDEVFEDFFIYNEGEKSFYQEYEIKDDEVKLIGLRKEAEKQTQYVLTDGTIVGNENIPVLTNVHKEKQMNKKEIVDALIANEDSHWTEEDREGLMAFSKAKVMTIVDNQKKEEATKNEEPEKKETKVVVTKVEPTPVAEETPAENKPVTLEEYISKAPKEIQDVLNSSVKAQEKQKVVLIEKITANKRNTFTPEYLLTRDLEVLEAIANLASQPAAPIETPLMPTFAGMAPLAPVENEGEEEEALEMPAVVNAIE